MSNVVHLSGEHNHIQLLLQKKLIFTPAFTNTCMYWEKEEECLPHLDPNNSSEEKRLTSSTSGTFSPKQMLWTVKVQILFVKDNFRPLCERSTTTFSNILPSETSSSPVVLSSSNRKWMWRNIRMSPGWSPNFCLLEQNRWRSVSRLEIHLGWLQLSDSSLISQFVKQGHVLTTFPWFLFFPCYTFLQFSDATSTTDRCSAAGVAECTSTSHFSQRPNSDCLDVVHELNCQIKKMSSGKASCPCGSERIWSGGTWAEAGKGKQDSSLLNDNSK